MKDPNAPKKKKTGGEGGAKKKDKKPKQADKSVQNIKIALLDLEGLLPMFCMARK